MGKKEPAAKSAAVIDIGASEIRLKIAQNGKGGLRLLDAAAYPLGIGRETFNTGKISFKKADKACEIIRQYTKIAQEYGVDAVRVVATSALREATNREYILDQIRLRTGVSVDVIDSQEEKAYLYKIMMNALGAAEKESALMVYIGSGSMGVSSMTNGRVTFMQNVRLGSLRISELFEGMQEYSREFQLVVEEYLRSFTDSIAPFLPQQISSFIATGTEISLIGDLCGAECIDNVLYVRQEAFDKLYEDIKYKSVNRIMEDYQISLKKAELLLPAMCIYDGLFEYTQADMIVAPMVTLIDAQLFEILQPEAFRAMSAQLDESTALACEELAARFGCHTGHYRSVTQLALTMFDKLKRLHGLGARERLVLQCAAILHDCGKIIHSRAHYRHSYNIIRGLDIVGLGVRETEIAANVALYHSRIVPTPEQQDYQLLSQNDRVIVSKLAAILRIADALDRSHTQKVQAIDVKLAEGMLTVQVTANRNMELEEWSFLEKGAFFQDVYGIETVIRVKRIG